MLGGTLGAIGPVGAAAGAVGAGMGIGAGGFYGGWEQASRSDPDPIVSQSINRGTQNQSGFQRGFMNFAQNAFPGLNLVNAVLYGGTGETLSSITQGDPSGGSPIGGPGFDYTAPVSQTSRAITQAVAPPAPVTPPPAAPLADDRKRNRIGRQETILTSRSALSDAPTVRPTLLGQ